MSDQFAAKSLNPRKILALLALAAAAASAYNAVGYLVYGGITYYTICAIAILFNFRKSNLLLWGAVGVHAVLVGYSLWSWETAHIMPCIYCFGAAGFALLAATVYTKLPVAILPALLIAGVWFAWPHLFSLENQAGASSKPVVENQLQPGDQTGVTVKPETGSDNAAVVQPAGTGSITPTNSASQESQTSNSGSGSATTTTTPTTPPEGTNTEPGQTGVQNPGPAGNTTTPAVSQGSGDTTKPADPPKPPETNPTPVDPPKPQTGG